MVADCYLCTAKKAEKAAEEDEDFSIHTRGTDDFGNFLIAKQI